MPPDAAQTAPPVEISASPGFTAWLRDEDVSLALTTYQTHRLMLVGVKADGSLSAFERLFDRPMGLAASGQRIWMATRHQLWRFENVLASGEREDGFDRLYVPRAALTTGALDVHDMALDRHGRVVFVNTRYGCLATADPVHSFRTLWRPPFLTATLPEDRCHLNGLAMDEAGEPAYVTAVSTSDEPSGWREQRRDGGVVVHVPSGEIVARGLSMPHSPRIDASGALWALDSGNGLPRPHRPRLWRARRGHLPARLRQRPRAPRRMRHRGPLAPAWVQSVRGPPAGRRPEKPRRRRAVRAPRH